MNLSDRVFRPTFTVRLDDRDNGITYQWSGVGEDVISWLQEAHREPGEVVDKLRGAFCLVAPLGATDEPLRPMIPVRDGGPDGR